MFGMFSHSFSVFNKLFFPTELLGRNNTSKCFANCKNHIDFDTGKFIDDTMLVRLNFFGCSLLNMFVCFVLLTERTCTRAETTTR